MNTTKTFEHPLEKVFNLQSGSTDFNPIAESSHSSDDTYMAAPLQEVSQEAPDDAEDLDIKTKIETIYATAMDAYENQVGLAEIVEPRYAARNAEVAAQYLGLALNAVSLKSRNKADKRKNSFIPFNNTTNINGSNVVVADRNEILRMMAEKKKNEGNP